MFERVYPWLHAWNLKIIFIFERGKFFGIMWLDTNCFENEAKNGPYRPLSFTWQVTNLVVEMNMVGLYNAMIGRLRQLSEPRLR